MFSRTAQGALSHAWPHCFFFLSQLVGRKKASFNPTIFWARDFLTNVEVLIKETWYISNYSHNTVMFCVKLSVLTSGLIIQRIISGTENNHHKYRWAVCESCAYDKHLLGYQGVCCVQKDSMDEFSLISIFIILSQKNTVWRSPFLIAMFNSQIFFFIYHMRGIFHDSLFSWIGCKLII